MQQPAPDRPEPPLRHAYDADFRPGPGYRDTLPDPQNAPGEAICGADVRVAQVGMSGFRLPLNFPREDGRARTLDVALTATVELPAGRKGINMSRLMREAYALEGTPVTWEALQALLERYLERADARQARLVLASSWPLRQESLRSGLSGWQYYPVRWEAFLERGQPLRRRLGLDFTYSSACPCSLALAEHARATRGAYSIPHSQRSVAKVNVELAPGAALSVEALIGLCQRALHTETQVMVRREDEQAFAELNGAYPKFVEDAARLLYGALAAEPALADFKATCAHLESLHNHDAVAVAHKGVQGGFTDTFEAL